MSENKRKIEVVPGDGSNLDISPVYEHLNAEKPKTDKEKPKNIVIPEIKSDKDKKDNNKE
jgi:hypothetical protein